MLMGYYTISKTGFSKTRLTSDIYSAPAIGRHSSRRSYCTHTRVVLARYASEVDVVVKRSRIRNRGGAKDGPLVEIVRS